MNEMIEEVISGLYRVEIPLPQNPLKALNSYLIKGDGRFLLIDTGMNRDECLSVMTSSLKRLGVDLERTGFFITHLHADHLGLAGTLATDASKVYFNEVEARVMNNHRQRIEELKEHHRNRLNEVICALQGGAKSAFQVAPYVTWDIEYKSWEQFPSQQKWFAFGETLAHLLFLEAEGKVRGEKQGGKMGFSLV